MEVIWQHQDNVQAETTRYSYLQRASNSFLNQPFKQTVKESLKEATMKVISIRKEDAIKTSVDSLLNIEERKSLEEL